MRNLTLLGSALIAAGVAGNTLFSAPEARAAFFQNSSGLATATSIIKFDEIILPYLTQVTTQYNSFGVSISPFGNYFTPGASGIDAVSNFIPYGYGGSRFAMDVIFSGPVTAAALQAYGPPDGAATFTAYLAGSPVESASAAFAEGSPAHYYGFNGIVFDRISISPYAPSGDPFGLGWRSPLILDNIQSLDVAPAPSSQVPGPLPWLAVGVGFGYSRKLRERIMGRSTPALLS
jgi:hypothetical protein